jgi:hypothetical protein
MQDIHSMRMNPTMRRKPGSLRITLNKQGTSFFLLRNRAFLSTTLEAAGLVKNSEVDYWGRAASIISILSLIAHCLPGI